MKKITQTQIGEVLGIGQPTVSKYLNSKLEISLKQARLLKDELAIPFEAWQDIKKYLEDSNASEENLKCLDQKESNL